MIFGTRLYVAFGDYGSNTGPLDIAALDLDSQTFGSTEITLQSEQTWTMRVLDGSLYLPSLDPQGSFDPTKEQLAWTAGGGVWSSLTNVDPLPEHVFGVCKTTDGLFLTGSAGTDAMIWRSVDDGATWTNPVQVAGSGRNRFYAVATFGDVILASRSDDDGPAFGIHAWDGATWTEHQIGDFNLTLPVIDTIVPFTIDGTDFWLCGDSGREIGAVANSNALILTQLADLAAQSAIAAALPFAFIHDAATDGTDLYVLGKVDTNDLPSLFHCDTAGTWTGLGTLDASVRSIAYDPAGWLYFGTTDSRILRTPIPS